MEYFDTHAHYEDHKFDEDREEILKKIYEFGVTKYVNIGTSIKTSLESIELADKNDFIYATVGIHPEEINEEKIDEDLIEIDKLTKNKKVVAIGEIGLDYHWNNKNKEKQKEVFLKQIEIANKNNLSVVIHTRDAIQDTIDIIRSKVIKTKAVLHCCPFNIELVKAGLENDFYIAFGGTSTFKNSKNAKEIIQRVPLENMLIETDTPYLAPEPLRGTRNDSRNLKYIVENIAIVKKMKSEEIARITYENAEKFYNLK